MDLAKFVEQKVNTYAEKIKAGSAKIDEHALGELTFYMAYRRVLEGRATPGDLGLMDAVNDILQTKGVLAAGASFLK
jgi:hypothetical protein